LSTMCVLSDSWRQVLQFPCQLYSMLNSWYDLIFKPEECLSNSRCVGKSLVIGY
jgi:hypothetical protein